MLWLLLTLLTLLRVCCRRPSAAHRPDRAGAPERRKREAPVVPRVSPNPHGSWVMGPDRGGAGDRPWRPPDRRLATTPALLAVWPRGGVELEGMALLLLVRALVLLTLISTGLTLNKCC